MNIIENIQDYETLLSTCSEYDWLIVPIYSNGNIPVYLESVSLLYVYVLMKDEEYIISFNHTEALNIDNSLLSKLPKTNRLYTHNKKRFYHFNNQLNIIDIDLVKYFETNSPFEDDYDTTAHEWFTRNFKYFKNLNTIIPIIKHFERCTNIRNSFLEYYTPELLEHSAFLKYNDYFTRNFYEIEKNGLYVNYDTFHKHFLDTQFYNNFTFSEYNIYTSTGRPSNRYGGINFAALNKENGLRACFTSRFGEDGFIMNLDFDAYHIRLLAHLVNYDFDIKESVHEHLGKMYFKKSTLTPEEYEESKKVSFKILYGGIPKEYLSVDFFKRIYDLTELLWNSFNSVGYIETPLFNRKLYKTFFTGMNASKLLNYYLQCFETERNCLVLEKLNKINCKSKIILYTYDSILIDFNKEDGATVIKQITEEMISNKFPLKISVGPDYQNLVTVKTF